MNDQDYIRKAADLADGWEVTLDDEDTNGPWVTFANLDAKREVHSSWQWVRDCLAAQLVRQVDALDDHIVESMSGWTAIREGTEYNTIRDIAASYGPDRSWNVIKAVVGSAALTKQKR